MTIPCKHDNSNEVLHRISERGMVRCLEREQKASFTMNCAHRRMTGRPWTNGCWGWYCMRHRAERKQPHEAKEVKHSTQTSFHLKKILVFSLHFEIVCYDSTSSWSLQILTSTIHPMSNYYTKPKVFAETSQKCTKQ